MVRNESAEIQSLFQQNVVPSYGRFDLVLSHGSGSQLWDVAGRRYLDLGGGIAVCSLGHAPAGHHRGADRAIAQARPRLQFLLSRAAGPAGAGAGQPHRPRQMLFLQQRRRGQRRAVQARAQIRPRRGPVRNHHRAQFLSWPHARGHRRHRPGQGQKRFRAGGARLPARALQRPRRRCATPFRPRPPPF